MQSSFQDSRAGTVPVSEAEQTAINHRQSVERVLKAHTGGCNQIYCSRLRGDLTLLHMSRAHADIKSRF